MGSSSLVKPLARAYILGLLSSTSPRFIRLLVSLGKGHADPKTAWQQICNILQYATALHRFPAFCGIIVGGSTLLQPPIAAILTFLLRQIHGHQLPSNPETSRRLVRFLAALISASVSFRWLNKVPDSSRLQEATPVWPASSHAGPTNRDPFGDPPEHGSIDVDDATLNAKSLSRTDLAGRTMDLTLFAVIRALDIVISGAWSQTPPLTKRKLSIIPRNTPVTLFCFSAATIMHSWFYAPLRLPRTYNRWISAAAELDPRLLTTLRHARFGTWVYDKDTGMAPLLGSMCKDYGLPEVMGDPARTIPIPCELVHMGQGKNCEKHALWRFWRGWWFAAKMYAPLQAIVLLRQARKQRRAGEKMRLRLPLPVLVNAFVDMARSSAFLGTFIASFYYGVCLSRTRLGPKLFSYKTITPQMWDSGLCVLAGCLLCGSSILVEHARKRLEILFFVLPRAAAVWFPRRYLPENRWKEHAAFALSAAILLTTAQEDPARVRGVFGKFLSRTLQVD